MKSLQPSRLLSTRGLSLKDIPTFTHIIITTVLPQANRCVRLSEKDTVHSTYIPTQRLLLARLAGCKPVA